jgi:hypothetical protein
LKCLFRSFLEHAAFRASFILEIACQCTLDDMLLDVSNSSAFLCAIKLSLTCGDSLGSWEKERREEVIRLQKEFFDSIELFTSDNVSLHSHADFIFGPTHF